MRHSSLAGADLECGWVWRKGSPSLNSTHGDRRCHDGTSPSRFDFGRLRNAPDGSRNPRNSGAWQVIIDTAVNHGQPLNSMTAARREAGRRPTAHGRIAQIDCRLAAGFGIGRGAASRDTACRSGRQRMNTDALPGEADERTGSRSRRARLSRFRRWSGRERHLTDFLPLSACKLMLDREEARPRMRRGWLTKGGRQR
jgi:hypothetical protein